MLSTYYHNVFMGISFKNFVFDINDGVVFFSRFSSFHFFTFLASHPNHCTFCVRLVSQAEGGASDEEAIISFLTSIQRKQGWTLEQVL